MNEKIQALYREGKLTEEGLQNAVTKGWISPEEAEELAPMLQPMIAAKIAESKTALADYLARNPLLSSAHGGKAARYSVTGDKQALLTSEMLMAQGAAAAGIPYELKWNATGQPCEEWALPELAQLAFEISAYVKPLVSRQQDLEIAISACTTIEELRAVEIDYSKPGENP